MLEILHHGGKLYPTRSLSNITSNTDEFMHTLRFFGFYFYFSYSSPKAVEKR